MPFGLLFSQKAQILRNLLFFLFVVWVTSVYYDFEKSYDYIFCVIQYYKYFPTAHCAP